MKPNKEDIHKVIKKGEREAELEITVGFPSRVKVFKNKKKYTRKNKHK